MLDDRISERLLDQRLRNRIMEAVLGLSEGLGNWGVVEYFCSFYDFMDGDHPYINSVMTEDEQAVLGDLCHLMNVASDETPDKYMADEAFVATGWPDRIKPVAQRVLEVFLKRGRFGEDEEESEPSVEAGQAWYGMASQSN